MGRPKETDPARTENTKGKEPEPKKTPAPEVIDLAASLACQHDELKTLTDAFDVIKEQNAKTVSFCGELQELVLALQKSVMTLSKRAEVLESGVGQGSELYTIGLQGALAGLFAGSRLNSQQFQSAARSYVQHALDTADLLVEEERKRRMEDEDSELEPASGQLEPV